MNQDRSRNGACESVLFRQELHGQDQTPLGEELVMFSDCLNEFLAINAFISESLANAITSEEGTERQVALGAGYCVSSLHERSRAIKESFDHLRRRHESECQT